MQGSPAAEFSATGEKSRPSRLRRRESLCLFQGLADIPMRAAVTAFEELYSPRHQQHPLALPRKPPSRLLLWNREQRRARKGSAAYPGAGGQCPLASPPRAIIGGRDFRNSPTNRFKRGFLGSGAQTRSRFSSSSSVARQAPIRASGRRSIQIPQPAPTANHHSHRTCGAAPGSPRFLPRRRGRQPAPRISFPIPRLDHTASNQT